jgi:hypothetical protein
VAVTVAVALSHKGSEGGGRVGEQGRRGIILDHAAAAAQRAGRKATKGRQHGRQHDHNE